MLMVRFAGMLTLVQHREWWRRVATQAVARYGPSGVRREEPYRGSEASNDGSSCYGRSSIGRALFV